MNTISAIDLIYTMKPISTKEPPPEGYFTAPQFAARAHIAATTARERLLALYRAGRLKRVSINVDGHPIYYYGLSEQEPSGE
jgi:hypothetical protein